MMKKLYCFDFDGTITQKDTMFLFLKFYNPWRYYFQYLKHIPLFILLKLKLLNAEPVKRSFVSSILKGERKEKLEAKAQSFFEKQSDYLIRANALDFIKNIDKNTTESLLVTASVDIWVRPFAEHFAMHLLATEAFFEDGKFTGEFKTPNCNGMQKVYRIRQFIEDKKYHKIIAFGDTSGDKAMMKFADESYYKFFH